MLLNFLPCAFLNISTENLNKLSKGFEILDIEKFEEGQFPRKLFNVVLKKIS